MPWWQGGDSVSARKDSHRVGAIVPEDYDIVLSYSLATTEGGWPVPSFRVNCELDCHLEKDSVEKTKSPHSPDGKCCIIGLLHIAKVDFAEHGGIGKCTVCGARFGSGDVWVHRTTGEHIHLGYTCADKYGFLAERGDFDAARGSMVRATAAQRIAESNRKEREDFLAAHPGLAEDLTVKHHIVEYIADKFHTYRSLSAPQIKLVQKLANEVRNPPPEEKHVPAPTGKVLVRGKVVSLKSVEGFRGDTAWKMTVKVETPEGSWLAWGTCPEVLVMAGAANCPGDARKGLRGANVEFSATLKQGNDDYFAIYSRPTKAKVISINKQETESK